MEEMKNTVVHTFGLEHPATLYFFACCEMTPNDDFLLHVAYDFAMGWPVEED